MTTQQNPATLDPRVRLRLLDEARRDAKLFVDEFGAALDPAATNWDGEAFAKISWLGDFSESQQDDAWDVYQDELVAETERLTRQQTPVIEVTRYWQDRVACVCAGEATTPWDDARRAAEGVLQDGERLADDGERVDGCPTWIIERSD